MILVLIGCIELFSWVYLVINSDFLLRSVDLSVDKMESFFMRLRLQLNGCFIEN